MGVWTDGTLILSSLSTVTASSEDWAPIFGMLTAVGRRPLKVLVAGTDVDAADVAIGDRVEMTFRRLFTADGIHNYFWKARPVRAGRQEASA